MAELKRIEEEPPTSALATASCVSRVHWNTMRKLLIMSM
jgi:hypothetical protein